MELLSKIDKLIMKYEKNNTDTLQIANDLEEFNDIITDMCFITALQTENKDLIRKMKEAMLIRKNRIKTKKISKDKSH